LAVSERKKIGDDKKVERRQPLFDVSGVRCRDDDLGPHYERRPPAAFGT
jgi:hypothetical protein